MKTNDLLLELSKFEINNKEKKYNGFSIDQSDAYYNQLDNLFKEYFFLLQDEMDNLLIDDNPNYTRLIQSKIDAFENLKKDLKPNESFLIELIEKHKKNVDRENSEILYAEHDLIEFYYNMFGVQMYFIETGIYKLSQALVAFSKPSISTHQNLSTVTFPTQMETPSAPKTYKERSKAEYIKSYFDENFKNKDILTNHDIQIIFGITRPTIQEWREKTKVLKKLTTSTPRNILYSKQEVIDACLSGKIRHLPGGKRK